MMKQDTFEIRMAISTKTTFGAFHRLGRECRNLKKAILRTLWKRGKKVKMESNETKI